MAEPVVDTIRQVLVDVARRRATITYEELLDALGTRGDQVRDAAEADLGPMLRQVSVAEDEAGRGLLTAVVVRRAGALPGGGFFDLAAGRGREVEDRQAAWSAELDRVHRAHAAHG